MSIHVRGVTHKKKETKCVALKKSGVGNNCFADVIPRTSSIHAASFDLTDHASWECCFIEWTRATAFCWKNV